MLEPKHEGCVQWVLSRSYQHFWWPPDGSGWLYGWTQGSCISLYITSETVDRPCSVVQRSIWRTFSTMSCDSFSGSVIYLSKCQDTWGSPSKQRWHGGHFIPMGTTQRHTAPRGTHCSYFSKVHITAGIISKHPSSKSLSELVASPQQDDLQEGFFFFKKVSGTDSHWFL